jgi:hypothetical protein
VDPDEVVCAAFTDSRSAWAAPPQLAIRADDGGHVAAAGHRGSKIARAFGWRAPLDARLYPLDGGPISRLIFADRTLTLTVPL